MTTYEKGRRLAREASDELAAALAAEGAEHLRLLSDLGHRFGIRVLQGTSEEAADAFRGINDELNGRTTS